eukprot:IDg3321t1
MVELLAIEDGTVGNNGLEIPINVSAVTPNLRRFDKCPEASVHNTCSVVVAGVGARGRMQWAASEFRSVPDQLMLTSATHDCASAALVSAVGEVYRARAKRESVVRCRVVRDASLQCAVQSPNKIEEFGAISARRSGVFIVRLRDGACVDHDLVGDANESGITDSEETCALMLLAEIFEQCGTRLAKLLTNSISEITLSRNPSRAAAMSSAIRFSDVREPFEMASKRLLESFRLTIFIRIDRENKAAGPQITARLAYDIYEDIALRSDGSNISFRYKSSNLSFSEAKYWKLQ